VDSVAGRKVQHRIRPHSLEDRPGADHPRDSMTGATWRRHLRLPE
jgi:hypothetical protein